MTSRTGLVAAAVVGLVFAAPAGGSERSTRSSSAAAANFTVKTFNLPGAFTAPWQLLWIADGTADGAIAFTDRGGNAVGLLDPTSGRTQRIPLTVITSPNGIAPIDFDRFAVAGAGGVAIFDRSGTGTITELQMPGTRNSVVATGADNSLFVPDFQNNDLRIIEAPYSGPADITKWALPSTCRGPTGVVPRTAAITVLCQQTNNIVDLSSTGTLLRTTPLPTPNMGAQEARPAPRGFVFSGFNANRVIWSGNDYPDPYNFIDVLLDGAAVSTVGYSDDSRLSPRIADTVRLLGQGKKPRTSFFFNTYTPSFRGNGWVIGTFPRGTRRAVDLFRGRNLVGSANGPGGSFFFADATPGRPAIHRVSHNLFGKTGRTQRGFRYPFKRLTVVTKDFLERMTYPFTGPGPRSTPKEFHVGIVGSSSSPWHVGTTFSTKFDLKLTARGRLRGGRTYALKGASSDFLVASGRAYRFTRFRPDTRSVTLTLRGTSKVPVDFGVYAQTPAAEPAVCECEKLTAAVRSVSLVDAQPQGLRLEFKVRSGLDCTGSGKGRCTGTLEVSPTRADRSDGLRIVGDGVASCGAECGKSSVQAHKFVLEGGANFGTQNLGKSVRLISLEIDRICSGKRSSTVVEFAFGSNGGLDPSRSDFNGNGLADGKEKR